MEFRKKIKARLDERLHDIYKTTIIPGAWGGEFFVSDKGVPFHLCTLEPNIIVVEYGDHWEDGDCFYVDEMTEDEIFEAILHEVNGAEPDRYGEE